MAKINFFYQKHVVEHLVIGLNDNGLFVSIPSENTDECYEVQCEESATRIEVKSCQCLGFKRHNHCKHTIIVQQWWDACYKPVVAPIEVVEPVVEETTITEVERKSWYIVNHTHQVWQQDGAWMCAEGAEFVEMVMKHLGLEQPAEDAPVERAQVWDKDICAMIYLDNREIVDKAAHEAAIKAQNDRYALNGAQQSAGLLSILPSRRKAS
jgi:hypothetical protein